MRDNNGVPGWALCKFKVVDAESTIAEEPLKLPQDQCSSYLVHFNLCLGICNNLSKLGYAPRRSKGASTKILEPSPRVRRRAALGSAVFRRVGTHRWVGWPASVYRYVSIGFVTTERLSTK
jgi:hypothetical protein